MTLNWLYLNVTAMIVDDVAAIDPEPLLLFRVFVHLSPDAPQPPRSPPQLSQSLRCLIFFFPFLSPFRGGWGLADGRGGGLDFLP